MGSKTKGSNRFPDVSIVPVVVKTGSKTIGTNGTIGTAGTRGYARPSRITLAAAMIDSMIFL
jgi:hypothetical protein